MEKIEAVLYRNVVEGLYAERKLQGDPDIIAKDDPDFLNKVIKQGKRSAELLIAKGRADLVVEARDYARRKDHDQQPGN